MAASGTEISNSTSSPKPANESLPSSQNSSSPISRFNSSSSLHETSPTHFDSPLELDAYLTEVEARRTAREPKSAPLSAQLATRASGFDAGVDATDDSQIGLVGLGLQNARFQSGIYAYRSGDYISAQHIFHRLAETAVRQGQSNLEIECQSYLLRILAEREEFDVIHSLRTRLEQRLSAKAATPGLDLKLKARALYVLGLCSVYQPDSHDEAMSYFLQSIQAAIESGDRASLAWPLYGAATLLYARERYEDALKELAKLTTLMQLWPVPELAASVPLLHALILRNMGQYPAALESAWSAFQQLKTSPNLVLYLQTLLALGHIHEKMGSLCEAALYTELAYRGVKAQEFPRVARLAEENHSRIQELLKQTTASPQSYDLRVDLVTGVLQESKRGEIRFEGQHVLRDLLLCLIRARGRTVSKEELVAHVWDQRYSAALHDNKIYVNIKRLRRALESDGGLEYILRGKTGYYLNPKARVLLIEAKPEDLTR